MIVSLGDMDGQLVEVDFDTMSITRKGESDWFPQLYVSEDADPTTWQLDTDRFVLVMYDEKYAEAMGFLIDPAEAFSKQGFDIDEVTPGGAIRVAVAWAREQEARYILRYFIGRRDPEAALKIFDTHDYK